MIGDGKRKVRLDAGGDVTLVTQQKVRGQPSNEQAAANLEGP